MSEPSGAKDSLCLANCVLVFTGSPVITPRLWIDRTQSGLGAESRRTGAGAGCQRLGILSEKSFAIPIVAIFHQFTGSEPHHPFPEGSSAGHSKIIASLRKRHRGRDISRHAAGITSLRHEGFGVSLTESSNGTGVGLAYVGKSSGQIKCGVRYSP